MLLAVDVGNTHTVYGLFEKAELRADWRTSTRSDMTEDEMGVLLRSLFDEQQVPLDAVRGLVVASVVPGLTRAIHAMSRRYFGLEPLFVGPGVKTGMPILYENPHEVGADRIVNALAAKSRHGAPVVVLDFGTATTFDVVGPGGEYLGGVIAPGLGISAEALFSRAARLHPVDIRSPQRVIGRNTEESVQAGLFHGYVALVAGLLRRIREELQTEFPVVATGGLAPGFCNELDSITEVDLDLTLEGLRLVWERNPPPAGPRGVDRR